MNKQITPTQLRRLFPGVSKSVLARNPLKSSNPAAADAACPPVAAEAKSWRPMPEQPPRGKFSLLVTIPVPDRKLSPNARVHWAQKQRLVREARIQARLAGWKAIGNEPEPRMDSATIRSKWFHRTAHRSDPDNLIARMKSTIDGIVEANILIDDRYLLWMPPEQFTDKENPRVELLISEP